MHELAERRCRPCEGGIPPLSSEQAVEMMGALHPDWRLSEDGQRISRLFVFPNFSRTIAFANAVAWVAIVEGHHPRLTLNYGDCEVIYWTSAIDGLTNNDFICAAKIDRMHADA